MTCLLCGPVASPAGPPAPLLPAVAAPSSGTPGASAQREFEHRKDKRAERVRATHPRIGGLLLALTDEPQSTTAWAQGAEGERRLGGQLDALTTSGCVVLHDRRIPKSRANIDHLVVAPSGIWIVDAKRYEGRVARRDIGGLFRTDIRLYVGNRDRSSLVVGMAGQVAAVRSALGADTDDVAVHPVLCFVDADWGLFTQPFTIDNVVVTWPKALLKEIRRPAPLEVEDVARVSAVLARHLRTA